MKRHPALAHLSREHHGALILARLLQKNAPPYRDLPSGMAEKTAYALKFYQEELIKHFVQEEKVLKLVTGLTAPLDLMVNTIFREHQEIHAIFRSITDQPSAPLLDELGKLLEMHIRKEERELFPMIEEACSEITMDAIELTLTKAENT